MLTDGGRRGGWRAGEPRLRRSPIECRGSVDLVRNAPRRRRSSWTSRPHRRGERPPHRRGPHRSRPRIDRIETRLDGDDGRTAGPSGPASASMRERARPGRREERERSRAGQPTTRPPPGAAPIRGAGPRAGRSRNPGRTRRPGGRTPPAPFGRDGGQHPDAGDGTSWAPAGPALRCAAPQRVRPCATLADDQHEVRGSIPNGREVWGRGRRRAAPNRLRATAPGDCHRALRAACGELGRVACIVRRVGSADR